MKISPSYFQNITKDILASVTIDQEVNAAKELAQQYEFLLEHTVLDKNYTDIDPTIINGGIALSSQHALDCLGDHLRTVRFIKGIHQAIKDSIKKFTKQPIEIIYAGCGPAAPLIIPLLTLFKSKEISITLIDINNTSITSVKKIINVLRCEEYFKEYLLTDATTYKHDIDTPPHIIISETMDKGLIKEPQVRIMQNLAPQLIAEGVFIPQEINIYRDYSFFAKESQFDINKDYKQPKINESKDKTLLFTITKEIATSPQFTFTSKPFTIPEDYTETPDITITALLKIYDNQILEKGESLLSNPICVTSMYTLENNNYELMYNTKDIPSWSCLTIE